MMSGSLAGLVPQRLNDSAFVIANGAGELEIHFPDGTFDEDAGLVGIAERMNESLASLQLNQGEGHATLSATDGTISVWLTNDDTTVELSGDGTVDLAAATGFVFSQSLTVRVAVATEMGSASVLVNLEEQVERSAVGVATEVDGAFNALPAVRFEALDDRLVVAGTGQDRALDADVELRAPGERAGERVRDARALLRLIPGFGGMAGNRNEVLRLLRVPLDARLAGDSLNPTAPVLDDYIAAFERLEREREVSIVCLPDCSWGRDTTNTQIVEAAIAHAEKTMDRMVIVDPPEDLEITQETDFTDLNLGASSYAALYYPWVRIPNPEYVSGTGMGEDQRFVLAPPCGFAAGIWARTDARRGVWKAPAGVEARLVGAGGLRFPVDDAQQDVLNPLGVNCFRAIPGAGQVVWGARTLGTAMAPEWRYVPVRRTALMIGESIRHGIQWAVFEPNDASLWRLLRVNAEGFMNGLFRAGAFQGTTARQAYFVRCGLDDGTMTQDNIDRGEVILLVGFAPVKPAEFVVVRVQQAESGSSISISS